MIKQRRTHLMAIWLGLFAMLMIHVGPLISGAQALLLVDTLSLELVTDSATPHDQHDHAAMLAHELTIPVASASLAAEHIEHADHSVDYHALMGHKSAPAGAPQWLANLEMCGYCHLLTLSPAVTLVVLLSLPVPPAVQWLATLPVPLRLPVAAYSLQHPRAPPIHLFA